MIVDAHAHYNTREDFIRNAETYSRYDSDRRIYPTLVPEFLSYEKATSLEGWIASLDRYGVDKVLLFAAPYGGNDSLAAFVRQQPDRFVGLANIDFVDPEGSHSVEELDRCVNKLGLKGIGELHPQLGPWDPGDERCFPVYEKAQALKIPIMVHGGSEPSPFLSDQRYGSPHMLDPALRSFPDLPFIVCHMAGDLVGQLLVLMRGRMNLYAEVSSLTWGVPTPFLGLTDVTPKSVLQKFIGRGYADRLLWGTDVQAPYNAYMEKEKAEGTIRDNAVVKLLDELNVSEEDRANILGGNTERLFGL